MQGNALLAAMEGATGVAPAAARTRGAAATMAERDVLLAAASLLAGGDHFVGLRPSTLACAADGDADPHAPVTARGLLALNAAAAALGGLLRLDQNAHIRRAHVFEPYALGVTDDSPCHRSRRAHAARRSWATTTALSSKMLEGVATVFGALGGSSPEALYEALRQVAPRCNRAPRLC